MRILFPALFLILLSLPAYATPYWDWQLTEPFNLKRDVKIYALDADSVSATDIQALNARGVKTVCYVSIGTIESYRSDIKKFPRHVIGKIYGDWPDERFLDIRKTKILIPIMYERFKKCKDMGFSAIEPDNMDVHINDSGFAISKKHMITYIITLSDIAHKMGLEFAQKNVPDLTPYLVDRLDFVMTANCFEDEWCADIMPYIAANKDVLAAEYTHKDHKRKKACHYARAHGIHTIFKTYDLNKEMGHCPR